ncbi:uncharacterized protein LOC128171026 isoform X1 [Crassostrea angulata]|uniref:uncharacterized protein LOC128171026 isoform X1 n=1 Tax=Magallana angulata TaxID=2784310 RepID=UPI0022B1CA1B|nr:uncharacterized protein LOC128171026 isoform X1 [Crassostrea angulata]
MAGNIASFMCLLTLLAFCAGFEINSQECDPLRNTFVCRWKGKGNYIVSTPLHQEILTMNYMTIGALLIVPLQMKGSLMKVEVKDGDIACSAIIVPRTVSVYITKQRCETSTSTPTPTSTQTSDFTPTGTQTSDFTPTGTQTSDFTPTGTQTSDFTPTGTQTSTSTPTSTQTSTSTPTGTQTSDSTSTPWQVLVYIFGVVIDLLHESKNITDLFKETSIQIFQCIVIILILRNRLQHYLRQNGQQPNPRPDPQQNPQPNRRTQPDRRTDLQQPLRRSSRKTSTPEKLNL